MTGWAVRAVDLPFGDREASWWVDGSGRRSDVPVPGADVLPGRFVLSGLVDAHAHPTVGEGPDGPTRLDEESARARLVAWAETGVTLIRDTGSPGGLTLRLVGGPAGGMAGGLAGGMAGGLAGGPGGSGRQPAVQAAGRFLAPADQYFPELLVEPVGEAELIGAARAEIERGATWVKVIADFPRVPEFGDAEPTYPVELIGQLCDAVHEAGARVAAHSTLPDAGGLVAAGVDSIEHGTGLDAAAIAEMGRRGVAWTPTLCAVIDAGQSPDQPPERRARALERRAHMAELLPVAVRAGVPVLTGTDVVGSLPREVALLGEMGLSPAEALAAASEWPRRFLGLGPGLGLGGEAAHEPPGPVDLVTYHHDPREDPAELGRPAAVVLAGRRLR